MDEGTSNKVIELNDKLSELETLQSALTTASLELRLPTGALFKMSKRTYMQNLLDRYTVMVQKDVEEEINAIKKQIEAL
mgnify:FL=1